MTLIESTLACLKPALPIGSRLIIFGSQARGNAEPDSDVDVLVIEPLVSNRWREISRLSALLGQQLIPADVVVMSLAAYEQQKDVVNTLAWRAAQEGQAYEFAP